MAALRYNLVRTTLGADISDSDLTITLSSPLQEGGVNVPTLTGDDYLWLQVEDELMQLTAYTAGATTGTVSRGEGDTVPAFHSAETPVRHVSTKDDFSNRFILTIAASDSSPEDIDAADYVCDGTADDVEINAAIDAVCASGLGGKVGLFPGSYDIAAAIGLDNGNVHLVGLSAHGISPDGSMHTPEVQLNRSGGGTYSLLQTTSGSDAHIVENLYMIDTGGTNTGPLILQSFAGTLTLRGSYVENGVAAGNAIRLDAASGRLVLDDSEVESDGDCIVAGANLTGIKVYALRTYFYSWSEWALDLSLDAFGYVKLVDCIDDGSGQGGYKITGDTGSLPMPVVEVRGGQVTGDGDDNIYLTNISHVRIEGVELGAGNTAIRLNNVDSGVVAGNWIDLAGHHGIWLLDCDDVLIERNEVLRSSRTTDATYSGIILDGNTNRCSVLDNMVRRHASGNQPLYGIRIDDSTCDDNLARGNDIYTSSKTAGNEFSDAGTRTRGWRSLVFKRAGTLTVAAVEATKARVEEDCVLGRTLLDVGTAPTGQAVLVDVNKGGTTIYTTQASRPTVAISAVQGQQVALSDVKAAVAGDVITADIDQIGSGTAGADLTVTQQYMPL